MMKFIAVLEVVEKMCSKTYGNQFSKGCCNVSGTFLKSVSEIGRMDIVTLPIATFRPECELIKVTTHAARCREYEATVDL